jgi:Rps23 Pro-64 3,4-dihydroxylase Tpa1-like proline 4-hydroxylase
MGVYFACGLALGLTLAKKPLPHHNSVTVDIVKEGNEILVYEHLSGDLIFEYNRTRQTDSSAYREFEDLSKFNRCLSLFSLFSRDEFMNPFSGSELN